VDWPAATALVAKGNLKVIKKYILKYVLESEIITIPLLFHPLKNTIKYL
jgi:hypothetical protein